MTFKDLQLSDALIHALTKKGYTAPTAIQQKTIPSILQGRDVLASAQTGTGKTAAFTLPLLQLMSNDQHASKKIRTLILSPTRELALQIGNNVADYKLSLKLKHTVIFGGVSQQNQVNSLRSGTDILIATPGRLKDLYEQKLIDLNHVKHFVLDEADRMLDSGFLNDVKKINSFLPTNKQTLLFSATLPREVEAFAAKLLRNPVRIAVQPVSSTSGTISQCVYHVEKNRKQELLVKLLRSGKMDRVLVFTTMKYHADKISRSLSNSGISSEAIHGNKTQTQRERTLEKFKSNRLKVLVATDVVARGIDIDELSHVINYELPDVAETYVHRIGRTGRKGRSGVAISFCSPDQSLQLKDIEKLISKRIPVGNHRSEELAPLN